MVKHASQPSRLKPHVATSHLWKLSTVFNNVFNKYNIKQQSGKQRKDTADNYNLLIHDNIHAHSYYQTVNCVQNQCLLSPLDKHNYQRPNSITVFTAD